MTRRLHLVTTDAEPREIGTIAMDAGGVAHCTGGALSVWRAMRRYAPSDADLFELLAGGWSNGPVRLVPGGSLA